LILPISSSDGYELHTQSGSAWHVFLIDCIRSARLDSITHASREGIYLQAVCILTPHKRLFKEKYEGAAGITKYDESQRVDRGQSIYSALVIYGLREKLHRILNSKQEFFVRGLLLLQTLCSILLLAT
jgi:hypothetical protein